MNMNIRICSMYNMNIYFTICEIEKKNHNKTELMLPYSFYILYFGMINYVPIY